MCLLSDSLAQNNLTW